MPSLDDVANDYANLPDRQRAERERVEDRLALLATSGEYEIQEIATRLGITRQQVTRITRAARERWAAREVTP